MIDPAEYVEILAARARRRGIEAETFVWGPSMRGCDSLYTGRHAVVLDGHTYLVLVDGELVVLGPGLSDEAWHEVTGRAGVDRLIRAVSLWGFGAAVAAVAARSVRP